MNKEITIYELLGLIKDDKAPNRILYDHYIWNWTGDDYHTILKTEKEQFLITGMYYIWLSEFLNDKVKIIEEDKTIEKFSPCLGGIMSFESVENIFEIYEDEINYLIDEINKLKESNND